MKGHTTGGDECGTGSYWLAIWELKRTFRIIWYDTWSDCQYYENKNGEYAVYDYKFSYDRNSRKMLVNKTEEIRYDSHNPDDHKVKHTSNKTFELIIDDLINNDLTDEINQEM